MKISPPLKFLCFLIFHLFLYILPSSSYTRPEKYFINCGTSQNISVNGPNFIGDENSGNSFTFSGSQTSSVSATNPTSTLPELYQTSRIFRQKSYYEVGIDQLGIYILRLHFYPLLNSSENLFNASFNVSASENFSLLSKFTVERDTQLPEIQEFLLTIQVGKFRVTFEPFQESSFAYITAIEVFLAPDGFIPDSAPHVSPSGLQNVLFSGLLSDCLHVVHRINVGGETLTSDNDTLWRNWIPDDGFSLFNGTAENVKKPGLTPNYPQNGATEFVAPNQVYNTAKMLKVGSDFNLTFGFNVSKNASHFVRVHFCDIISNTTNENAFKLFIYSGYGKRVQSSEFVSELAAPFYIDFMVESDDTGKMNIGVGLDEPTQPAFLNGVEIMEQKGGRITGGKSKSNSVVIVGLVVGGCIVILILVAVLIFVLRRGKKKNDNSPLAESQLVGVNGGNSYIGSTQRTSTHSPLQDLNLELRLSLSAIAQATDNFNQRLIIGEGGFGKVYSGVLSGKKVAVKRSETGHGQGLPEFHTEINVLSRLRHRHLVSLIGYCDEGSEMILVYEFMEKGTLREHLYKMVNDSPGNYHASETQLSWEKRLEICIGAANGLHYLHACLDGSIIHRDVKSTNILLDEDFTAKVSDFGLSKQDSLDQTHVSTVVKGSFGYLDPEYYNCMQLTQKSDVYSFGVVLIEVLCARPVINQYFPRDQVNLPEWALDRLKKGLLETIIDPLLVGQINPNSLRKYGETFQKCLEESSTDRPTMLDVSWNLEYALRLQRPTRIFSAYNGDSTTDVSVNLPSMVLNRLPSYSSPFSDIGMPEGSEDMDSNASQVFSQLKMDQAR